MYFIRISCDTEKKAALSDSTITKFGEIPSDVPNQTGYQSAPMRSTGMTRKAWHIVVASGIAQKTAGARETAQHPNHRRARAASMG